MNSFVSSMQKDNNMTLTENGALAMKSTYRDIVDLFGRVRRGVPVDIESCTQETYMKAGADATMKSIELPSSVICSSPSSYPMAFFCVFTQEDDSSLLTEPASFSLKSVMDA